MAATYTLSGNPKTLLGGEDFERVRAYVTVDQDILTDPDTEEVRIIGEADLILSTADDTTFEVDLPGNGWTPSPHFYTIHIEGRSRTTGLNRVVTTQAFQMTADTTMGELPQAAPKAITVTDYENLIDARDEAKVARDQAVAIVTNEAVPAKSAPTAGGATRQYLRVGTLDGLNAMNGANLDVKLAGVGDIGSQQAASIDIKAVQRDANTIHVDAMFSLGSVEAVPGGLDLYTRQVSTYGYELWIRRPTFARMERAIAEGFPVGGPTGAVVTMDQLQTSAPSGLVAVSIGSLSATIDAQVAAQAFDPEDVGFDVWLLAGQSNTSGRAADFDGARIDVTNNRYWQYAATGAYADKVSLAVEPLGFPDATTGMGISNSFAQRHLSAMPLNRRLLVVPAAYGGTGFVVPDSNGGNRTWLIGSADNGNNLYENAIRQTQAALAAAGPNARLCGILWLQGETDALNGSGNAAAYQARLDALIDGFRTRFGIADLPFILGQMRADVIAAGSTFQTVNATHIDTPRRKVRTAFAYGPVGSTFYNGDALHYNAAGERFNGSAMADAVAIAKANILGAVPVPPPGVTLTQSGTSILVTWTRPAGRATDYLVEHRLSGGSWATLTRAQSIDNTATITGRTLGSSYEVRVSTINEQGTSAASAVANITLVVAPGQVTGLAAGTPTATALPLSWTAVSGATGYKVEYKKTADSTWTTWATVAGVTSTITGLLASTGYDTRVSAVNAAGAGTVSSTVSASTATLPMLLTDVSASAWRAYSVARRIKSSYSGALIRVRRSSDNTEADINAVGDVLDTATLLTFAGAGDAYVKTVYDQSGTGANLTQATTAAQPAIVLAGVLQTVNTQPAMKFNGTSHFFTDTTIGLYAAGASTVAEVGKLSSAGTSRFVTETRNIAFSTGLYYQPFGSNATTIYSIVTPDSGGTPLAAAGQVVFDGNAHVGMTMDTGSSMSSSVDASVSGSNAYNRGTTTNVMNNFNVGARVGGVTGTTVDSFINGLVSELVVWKSLLSGGDQTACRSNQKSFYGTP